MKRRRYETGIIMKQKIILAGVFLVVLLPLMNGAEPVAPVKSTNLTTVVATAATTNAHPASADAAAESDAIVIEYSNIDIQAVLRTLATKAGVSLILGDNVTGMVTVHLEDVAYTNAMKLIAESKGFAYAPDKNYKNLVKIQSKAALESEPSEMRVIALRYAKAEDLKGVIVTLLSAQGKILVDPRVNTLILSDVPSNLVKLQALVEELDTQTPQVEIEAKFVERTRNPKKDIGINWTQTMLNHNMGIRRGDPATAIKSDTITPGVGGAPGTVGVNNPSPLEFSKNLSSGPWTMPTAIFDGGEAQVVFSFLAQDTDTELLANPRVVTTDNGPAKISISTEYPIPQFTYNTTIGALQISGFNYKDIGIILAVTPRINKDEYITLDVVPEASSFNGFTSLSSGGGSSVQIPIVDSRNTKTTVLIKSGHTLAIGGMTRQDTTDSYTKVPIMGSLPGLGSFFRSKSLSKLKRDLYIFLTPTVIRAADLPIASQAVTEPLMAPVYLNDRWMPHDTARPPDKKPVIPKSVSKSASTNSSAANFKP